MMRWWLDRGVDGFRMDVINMISKDVAADGHLHDGPPLPGSSLGDGSASYLCGPRIHEFLAEMHREVFAGRDGTFLTVGEMPGVTVEEARLFTDPARGRGGHGLPVRARRPRPRGAQVGRPAAADARPQGLVRPVAGRPGRRRVELPLLGQPRPAPGGVPVRRRQPALPARLGDLPGHAAAPAPGDAVRLPGPGDRHGELPVRDARRLPRPRVAQPLRARGVGRGGPGARARRPAEDEPGQRPHAGAVGRLAVARGSPPGRRGCRSTPTTRSGTPSAQRDRRGVACSRTTSG